MSKELNEKMERALSSVEFAIDLLRDVARADQVLAELLEDILYHLEEAAESLSVLLEERKRGLEKS
jgi:1,4-dihydroxy-2-naphthoyl-CoA synthase